MRKFFIILVLALITFSCSQKVIDVKSPCVSNEDGPCGPKKSINNWWLNSQTIKQNS